MEGISPRGKGSLVALVAGKIKQAIADGSLSSGDKLPPEPRLVDEFGVSRTVVREAVASLRAAGFLESRHGVGVFVRSPPAPAVPDGLELLARNSDKISDLIEELEVRAAVEIEAAGLAARRASPAQEADIEASMVEFARCVDEGRSTEVVDFEFHMAVARATNNARFIAFLTHLGRRTIPRVKLRRMAGGASILPEKERRLYDRKLLGEHRAIAVAIFSRDEAAARGAMRTHLMVGMERYRALTRRIGAQGTRGAQGEAVGGHPPETG